MSLSANCHGNNKHLAKVENVWGKDLENFTNITFLMSPNSRQPTDPSY